MCTQRCLFCCQTVQGVVFLNTTTVGVPKFLNAPFCLFSCCYDSKESWCMCLYGAPVLWCVSVCEREWKRYLFSVELCLCVCAVSACAQQSVDKRLRGGEEKLAALFCWKYANAIHLVFISQMFALFAAFTFDFFFFFLWGIFKKYFMVICCRAFDYHWHELFFVLFNFFSSSKFDSECKLELSACDFCCIPSISCRALNISADSIVLLKCSLSFSNPCEISLLGGSIMSLILQLFLPVKYIS